LSPQQIQDLEQYEQSTAHGDQERAVLRFTEQWTRQGRVAGDVLEHLKQSRSPAKPVTLARTVGLANCLPRLKEAQDRALAVFWRTAE
jgi:alkylhydroperoxidase family enzyme